MIAYNKKPVSFLNMSDAVHCCDCSEVYHVMSEGRACDECGSTRHETCMYRTSIGEQLCKECYQKEDSSKFQNQCVQKTPDFNPREPHTRMEWYNNTNCPRLPQYVLRFWIEKDNDEKVNFKTFKHEAIFHLRELKATKVEESP